MAGRGPARRSARGAARRRTASTLAVVLVASGLGYVAVASQGTTVHEAALNDAGVWVSSDAQAKFARANVPIGQLDTGVATSVAAGSGLDVLQDGAAVVGVGTGAGQLFPIDPRTSTAADPAASLVTRPPAAGRFTPLPVDLRGGTIALLDRESGKVWAQRVDSRAGITGGLAQIAPSAKPVAAVGKDAAIAVDTTGTVHAVSGATGRVTTVPVIAGRFAVPVVVPTALRSPTPDITAVGTTWVAYDAAKDTVHTASEPDGFDAQVTTPGGARHAALQQPGPDADSVAIEGPDRAALVPLDGGISPGGVRVEERVGRLPAGALVTRPVVLGGCLHAAWAEAGQVFYGANCGGTGDEPTATLPTEGEQDTRDGVAFRVNRDLVVLNDLDNGGVWDLDDKPTKIDNWDALVPPTRTDDKNQKKDENLVDEASLNQPPKAQPDTLSVRPGLTSKLHVLDNDTDVAGSVLSIDQADVSRPTLGGVSATVSADGQAIDVSVPERTQDQAFTFDYAVNNGKVKGKGTARVTVRIVPDSVNGPPKLRQGGAALADTQYPVIAGKRLSVPVLADWRDPESDILAARADTEGGVVDGQGRITLTAPTKVGRQTIPYLVTDGRTGTTRGSVVARVIGTSDSAFVAPKTQPDAVRGVIGKPLQIEPLGNDVAGADPGEPDAVLRLRSEVRPVGPLEVDTDLATGQVTVTGSAPGTYELTYSAQTGAGAAPGRVRVDLVAPPEGAPPVAVPDTATLHDQSPVMVDVLANDYSPRGDVLVTASVESTGEDGWLQPSIYQGRWVRIEAREPSALDSSSGRRGTVRYTVSDGTQRTSGQVSVLQQGPLDDSLPLVEDDTATVREGDTVSVPVLDNDTMADGIPLQVDPASVTVVSKGDAQRAFASGNVVRYVPEARGLRAERFVTIEYAAFADGMKDRAQTARVRVQVTPLPDAQRVNQAPVARSFTATVTSGDPITMTVPTFGVDADGDSASVTGIVGADGGPVDLIHGRVVAIGPSTIRYESYPLAAGTEVISYEVQDRFGATSRAFVRVGVVQPGDPQPPVAVADEVFAAPGKTVTVKPLQNDLIARGDVVEVDTESVNDDATRRLWRVEDDNTVTTKVPADTARLHELVYGISDGLFDPSRASILVRPVKGHVNAPVARDDVAAPKPGETSTLVDVLANDSDVDSDPATLRVVEVLSADASIENGRVRVRILDHPYAAPYVIEDEDGARAMALVQVPTGANGQPFVVAGSLIQMDKDSSRTVALGDHVKSPRDRVVSATTAGTVSASPAENLSVSLDDNRTLTLQSTGGYVGPAAVMLEVTDQDAVDQKDFGTAYVSIPVQVGPRVPLLRCPGSAVRVVAGGLPRVVDIPTLCHAWLPVGMSLDEVSFQTRWESEPEASLAVDGPGGRRLTLRADLDAQTSRGRLAVTTAGLERPVMIGVDVVGADGQDLPPPRLRPISVTGLEEGQSRTLDVKGYLDSPLAQPRCSITSASVESGSGLQATASGCRLTLTVGPRPSPTASVALTVSDGPERTAEGRVSVTMLGSPSQPRQVRAVADRDAGGQARVSWLPPTYDGGSAVSGYTVTHTGGSSGTTRCTASPCTITGLTNGRDYTFTVVAENGVGRSAASAASNTVRPDTLPRQVTGVRMVDRGDGTLTIGWTAPENEGSALQKYVVRVGSSTGATKTQDVPASSLRATVGGLDNEAEQSVQVQAWNELGAGPFGPAVTMQSAGTPPALPAPSIAASGPGPAADSATLTVSWDQGRPNGPPIIGYTLYRSVDGGAWAQVARTSPDVRTARDVIPYDGRTYRYTATVTNGADLESPQGNAQSFTSNGVPSTPSVQASTPTGNREIRLTVAVGQPRAASFTAIRWSGGGRSGTYPCGCAPGSQVVFSVGPFDTSPTANYTITVWTVSSGGGESTRVNDSATPYGATLTPTGFTGSRSGPTGATWSWNLPTNGRPIDQVQLDGDVNGTFGGNKTTESIDRGPGTYQLRVRSHSVAGWSGWTGFQSVTVPNPTPEVYNVRKGPRMTVPNGSGCTTDPCPRVDFDIRDFPVGGGGWSVTAIIRGGADTYTSSVELNPNGSGSSYTWRSTGIVVDDNNGPVGIRLCRGGTCYTSPLVGW